MTLDFTRAYREALAELDKGPIWTRPADTTRETDMECTCTLDQVRLGYYAEGCPKHKANPLGRVADAVAAFANGPWVAIKLDVALNEGADIETLVDEVIDFLNARDDVFQVDSAGTTTVTETTEEIETTITTTDEPTLGCLVRASALQAAAMANAHSHVIKAEALIEQAEVFEGYIWGEAT